VSGWRAVLSLRARLSHRRLDRELGAGAVPDTPLLQQRARTLAGARMRERVASGLEGAVAEGKRTHWKLTAAVSIDARAVNDAEPLLLTLALTLRQPGPVSAQGVALALTLLTDGESSLYYGEGSGDLAREVRAATDALHRGPML
jgi:hypothetical protein